MTSLLALLLLQAPTPEPITSTPALTGTAAYSYHIESAADVRGLSLAGRHGCAVLDFSLIGRDAWVFISNQWLGPLRIVDCTAAHHRHLWAAWRRVIDLPWALWETLHLPLAPVPALVTFSPPTSPTWY